MTPEQELERALLAYAVYKASDRNRLPVDSWQLDSVRSSTSASGFVANVYTRGNEVVVAFRGTDGPSLPDWFLGNLGAASGFPAPQVFEAINLVADVLDQYDGANISFTGHSLGGGLASLMAAFFDCEAAIFDPAPFGHTARNNVIFEGSPGPGSLALYFAAYLDRQLLLGRAPSLAFSAYAAAFVAGNAVIYEPVYQQRLAKISGTYLEKEVLVSLRLGAPTVISPDSLRMIPIGDSSLQNGTTLHNMSLLLAMMASESLAEAAEQLPTLLSNITDPMLYWRDAEHPTEANLLNLLLRDHFRDGVPNPGSALDRFSQDMLTLAGANGIARSHSGIRDALIVASMEYFYFKDLAGATYLFTLSQGGLHFNFDDIGDEERQSQLYSPTRLAAAAATLADPSDLALTTELQAKDVWHIQIGDNPLNWTANPGAIQDDVAIGGTGDDAMLGGAGDDILIGNAGMDSMDGGAGFDRLYGGFGADTMFGGADNDLLYGGQGSDTYIYNNGGGTDTVKGDDNDGSVLFQGVTLTGANAEIGISASRFQWTWTEGGQSFVATMLDGDVRTGGTLSIATSGAAQSDRLVVENFATGDLGISLNFSNFNGIQPGPVGDIALGPFTFVETVGGVALMGDDGSIAFVENNPDGSNPIILPAPIGIEPPPPTGTSYVAGWAATPPGSPNPYIYTLTHRLTMTSAYGLYYSVSRAEPLVDANNIPSLDAYYLSPSTAGQYSTGPEQIDISNSYSVITAANGGYPWQAATGHLGDDHITGSAIRDYLVDDFARTSNDQLTTFGSTFTGTSYLDVFGNDVLLGQGGDDWIETHGGNDIVFGGADNDVIIDTPVANGDYAYSAEWVDTLGHTNRDSLLGEDGDDVIIAGAGEGFLDGGDGNDELFGGADDDILNGGEGNDILSGDTQQAASLRQGPDPGDIQNFYSRYHILPDEMGIVPRTPESAIISASFWQEYAPHSSGAYFSNTLPRQGNDILNGGAGDDLLIGGGGNDILSGGADNDVLQGDLLFIPSYAQNLLFSDASMTPLAMHGNDFLSGGDGNDTLYGGSGNDRLNGDAGNDILYGGEGADSLYGGAGNDTLYGDASDLVIDGGEGADTVYGSTADDMISLSAGGDTAHGGDGNDTYVIDAGVGSATIVDVSGSNSVSVGRNLSLANLSLVQAGGVVQANFGNGDVVSTSMAAFFGLTQFEFQESGETLTRDQLIEQTYLPVALGDPGTNPDYNAVHLGSGVAASEIGLLGYNQNLVLTYEGTESGWVNVADLIARGALVSTGDGTQFGLSPNTQVVVLHNWYLSPQADYLGVFKDSLGATTEFATAAATTAAHYFVGTDEADTLQGSASNDVLEGGPGDDLLEGNTGDDVMEGATGNDAYVWNAQDGFDTIDDSSGFDRVYFGENIGPGDLTLTEVPGGLQILVGPPANYQGLLILNQVENGQQIQPIELIQFSDGSFWGSSEIDAHITGNRRPRVESPIEDLAARPGSYFSFQIQSGTIVDPDAGDSITYSATNAAGSALPLWMSFDATTQTFSGYRPSSDVSPITLRLTATDSAGLSTVTEFDVFSHLNQQAGTQAADSLDGSELPDTLQGFGGNDTLVGGEGNDELDGGDDEDQLSGGAGSDLLTGGWGDDDLNGGAGDDILDGRQGADRFLFDENFGHDTLRTTSFASTIEFSTESGIEFADLTVTRQGDDLRIAQGNNSINIEDWYRSTENQIERLVVNQGSYREAYSAAQLGALVTGTDLAPVYTGPGLVFPVVPGETISFQLQRFSDVGAPGALTYTAHDFPAWLSFDPVTLMVSGVVPQTVQEWSPSISVIDAAGLESGVAMQIYPGVTRTSLIGTAGNDTILGNLTAETLNGLAGNDTLDGGSDPNNILNGGDGNDLLSLRGSGDRADGGNGDDQIEVQNTSNEVYGGYGNDTINNANWAFGLQGDDTVLGRNGGDDSLQGNDGNDFVDGRSGQDIVYGGPGNDTVRGGAGNDSVYGESGNDTLDGGTGNDRLDGFTGDDRYVGFTLSTGADQIRDQGGYDTIEFSAGANLSINDFVFSRHTSATSGAFNPTGNDLRISYGDFRIDVEYWYGTIYPAAELGFAEELVLFTNSLRYAYTTAQIEALVSGINAGPIVNQQIASRAIAVGAPLSITVAQNTFSDSESQFSLQYSATLADGSALPSWLQFDAGTGVFAGTPALGDEGLLVVRLHALDVGGLSAQHDFAIAVGTPVVQGNSASDQLSALAQPTLVTGGAGDDFQIGNNGNDFLSGDAGNDVLQGRGGADRLVGGEGNDVYIVDSFAHTIVENAIGGQDEVFASISYALSGNIESLTLTGNGNINATGNTEANRLTGNAANNRLDGGAGSDTMIGGQGDDVYVVENSGDRVDEELDGGTDSVESSMSWTLSSNVENLILTGSGAINGTGNDLQNFITGNLGINTLDGGSGADVLAGGAGDDIYIVDNGSDNAIEAANEGTDEVRSSVSFAIGANIERLLLTGSASINGTGNSLNNVITGNSGNNVLDGVSGTDTLTGGAGNDTYVTDGGDTLNESPNQGTDTVISGITWTLATNFENLQLSGSGDINGTGNSAANVLTGNSGNNLLNGGTGADTMIGGAGNDTYTVDVAGDVVAELLGEGTDLVQAGLNYTLSANVENLTLTGTSGISGTGNALNNVLTGNSGANTLTGLGGNDTYVVSTGDTVVEASGGGIDTVQTAIAYILGSEVENLTLTNTGATVTGTGNSLANVLTGSTGSNTLVGNGGNDTLDGGSAGTDVLQGGQGDDTYLLNRTSGVTISENASEGTDTVLATVAHTLGLNVENLTLLGSSSISGTGNALDNVLIGNTGNNSLTGSAGNDTLDGGSSGTDTLQGGAGDDIYIVNRSTGIAISESAGQGVDTVRATVSWTLTSEVENLVLLGSGNINGTGNSLANSLSGTSGSNTLEGGDGNDLLDGGQELHGYPTDDDILIGGAGNDTLLGGIGNDVLEGDSGNDTLDGGSAYYPWAFDNDELRGGSGNDTYIVGRFSATYSELYWQVWQNQSPPYTAPGEDLVMDYDTTAGNVDILQFSAPADALRTLWRYGNDLVIEHFRYGTNPADDFADANEYYEHVRIQNYFLGAAYEIEQIRYGTGPALSLAAIVNGGYNNGFSFGGGGEELMALSERAETANDLAVDTPTFRHPGLRRDDISATDVDLLFSSSRLEPISRDVDRLFSNGRDVSRFDLGWNTFDPAGGTHRMQNGRINANADRAAMEEVILDREVCELPATPDDFGTDEVLSDLEVPLSSHWSHLIMAQYLADETAVLGDEMSLSDEQTSRIMPSFLASSVPTRYDLRTLRYPE